MKVKLKEVVISQGTIAFAYVIFGTILFIRPEITGTIICYTTAAFFLIYGIIKIASYLRNRSNNEAGFFRTDLIIGIAMAAIGLFTLLQPHIVLSILPIFLGITLLINGISKLQRSIALKRFLYPYWWVALVFALVTIGFGGLLIYNPFSATEVMIQILGFSLILDGASDLWSLFCYSRQSQKLK